jgi:hypothetical protein
VIYIMISSLSKLFNHFFASSYSERKSLSLARQN